MHSYKFYPLILKSEMSEISNAKICERKKVHIGVGKTKSDRNFTIEVSIFALSLGDSVTTSWLTYTLNDCIPYDKNSG